MRRRGACRASAARPDRTAGVGTDVDATGPRAAARTASAVRGRPLGDAGRTLIAIESTGTCGVRVWDSADRVGDGSAGAGGGALMGGPAAVCGVGRGSVRGDTGPAGGEAGREFTGGSAAGGVATVPVRNTGCRGCLAGRFALLFFGCFSPLDGAGSRRVGAGVTASEDAADPGSCSGAAGGASRSNALWNFPRTFPIASGRLQVLRPPGAGVWHMDTARQLPATTRENFSSFDGLPGPGARCPVPGFRCYDVDQTDDPPNGSRVGGGPPAARYGPLEVKPIRAIMTARGALSFDDSTGE